MDPTAPSNSQQRQRALVALLCSSLPSKGSQKALLVLTKCDRLSAEHLGTMERENEHLSKMLQVPVVCTSATRNVNINELVMLMATSSRGRGRGGGVRTGPLYVSSELAMQRQAEDAKMALATLLRYRVTVFEVEWKSVKAELAQEEAFLLTCYLVGTAAARTLFQERLLEIKLDAVKAKVKEEARLSSNSDYGALAAHLLIEKAKDIEEALSAHPEFKSAANDLISPYMKVSRDQLTETLGLDPSAINTTVEESGYVKFIRSAQPSQAPATPEPSKARRPGYERTTLPQAPSTPKAEQAGTRASYEQRTLPHLRTAGQEPSSTYGSLGTPPPQDSSVPEYSSQPSRTSYEHRRLPTPTPHPMESSPSPFPGTDGDVRQPLDMTELYNRRLPASDAPSRSQPGKSALPHPLSGSPTLPRPDKKKSWASTLPANAKASQFAPRMTDSLPRMGKNRSRMPYESQTLPRKLVSDGSASPEVANKPMPSPRLSVADKAAIQKEMDEQNHYLEFTCDGQLPEGVSYDDGDKIYDDVNEDGGDHDVEGEHEDGHCVYVRANDARRGERQPHPINDDIYDDLDFVEQELDDDGEIDPYSQYSAKLEGLDDAADADVDPYARCKVRGNSLKAPQKAAYFTVRNESMVDNSKYGTLREREAEDDGEYEDDYSVPAEISSPYDTPLTVEESEAFVSQQGRHSKRDEGGGYDNRELVAAALRAKSQALANESVSSEDAFQEEDDPYDEVEFEEADSLYMNVSEWIESGGGALVESTTPADMLPRHSAKKQPRPAPRGSTKGGTPTSPPPLPGGESQTTSPVHSVGAGSLQPPPLPDEDETFASMPPPLPAEERSMAPPLPGEEDTGPPPLPADGDDQDTGPMQTCRNTPRGRTPPPLPGEETLPPLPGEETLPPLPGDEGLPPLPGDEGLPPLPGDEGLPPLPCEEESRSFPPVHRLTLVDNQSLDDLPPPPPPEDDGLFPPPPPPDDDLNVAPPLPPDDGLDAAPPLPLDDHLSMAPPLPPDEPAEQQPTEHQRLPRSNSGSSMSRVHRRTDGTPVDVSGRKPGPGPVRPRSVTSPPPLPDEEPAPAASAPPVKTRPPTRARATAHEIPARNLPPPLPDDEPQLPGGAMTATSNPRPGGIKVFPTQLSVRRSGSVSKVPPPLPGEEDDMPVSAALARGRDNQLAAGRSMPAAQRHR